MLKINIRICCDKSGWADIEFICDLIQCITGSDGISARIFSAAVDRHIDIRPGLQASRI